MVSSSFNKFVDANKEVQATLDFESRNPSSRHVNI
jgi:hypothetical protein